MSSNFMFSHENPMRVAATIEAQENPYLVRKISGDFGYGYSLSSTEDGTIAIIRARKPSGIIISNDRYSTPIMIVKMTPTPREIIITPDGKRLIAFEHIEYITIFDIDMEHSRYQISDRILVSFWTPILKDVSHDSRMFCVQKKDGNIEIWDMENKKQKTEIKVIDLCNNESRGYSFSQPNDMDRRVKMFFRRNATAPPVAKDPTTVNSIAFSSDDSILLVIVAKHIARLYSTTTGEMLMERSFHFVIDHAVSNIDPKKFILVSKIGKVFTWHIHLGLDVIVQEIQVKPHTEERMKISLDGSMTVYESVYNSIVVRDREGNSTDIVNYIGVEYTLILNMRVGALCVVTNNSIDFHSLKIFPRCTKEIFQTFDYEARKTIRFLFLLYGMTPEKKNQKTISRLEMLPRDIIYVIFSHIRRSY